MLKIARGFGHKTSGKQRLKYRLDVWVEKVDNLPKPLKRCRVVWSRGPKLQMTDIKDVSNSVAVFKQKLSQIATMYKDPQEGFEAKEYKFQLQVPGKDSSAKLITVGKGELDLSFFVAQEGVAHNKMVPIICKVGAASTAYLKLVITAEQVTGALDDEDGMTEVSGMTGMTAAHLGEEQDLSGFDEPEEPLRPSKAPGQGKPAAPSSAKPRASRLSPAPSPAAAATGREAAAAVVATPGGTKAATGRAVPTAIEEEADGDVSPLNLSPSSSVSDPSREPGGRGAGKPSVITDKSKAAVAAGRKLTNAKADLFGSATPTASSSRPRASKASALTEDEARAELFGSSSSSSRAQAAAARPLKAPTSSKTGSAPPAGAEPGLPVAAAAVQRQGSSSSLASSSSASTAAGRAGSAAAGTPVGGRRALLDRSAIRGATAAAVEPPAPSTSKADASSTKRRGGTDSSSDTDDDDPATGARGGGGPQAEAQPSTSGRTPGSSSTSSRIPTTLLTAASAGSAARRPAAAAAAAGGDGAGDAAAARLTSENEKLRAQLVALRDAAAASEEARRLARLAAETAAAERDDCRAQAQELQDQLKEAVVGMITAAEASELAGQVRSLQLELQQQADQHLHQLQQQADKLAASQAQQQQQQQAQQLLAAADERLHLLQQQLLQQARDADEQLQALQQQLDQANAQLQQQQEGQQQQEESRRSADSSGSQQSVAELQQQLAAMSQQVEESVMLATRAERQKKQLADQVDGLTQQLESSRQQQRQQEAADSTASSKPGSGDVPGISSLVLSLRSRVAEAEQKACAAEKQRDDVLARLVEEASVAGRQAVLSQQLASRQDLAAEVQESLTGLELDEGAQAMACQVLLTLKAAAAAARQGEESEQRFASKIKVLTAALNDADRELRGLKSAGQHGRDPQPQCSNGAVLELQQQLDQLRQQNAQLQKQLASLPAKLLLQSADDAASQGHSPLIRAGLQGFGPSPGSSLGSSRDGDSSSQVLLPGGDDQVLQLQAALHAALADGQQCRRKLKAREKELQLVQVSDASSSGQSQRLLAAQQQLDSAHSRTQQLLQDRNKLQVVLCDLEIAAAQEKAELLGQLAAAHQELRQTVLQKEQVQRQLADALQELARLQTQLQQIQQQLSRAQQEQQRLHQCLEAAEAAATPAVPAAGQLACQVIALADSAGPSGTQEALAASQEQVAELQRQLSEAEATRRSLTKECGRLKKQLADEQEERTTLEDQLAQHLEDTGDDVAQEAVAAYEAKYSRLKSRYRQLAESHHEEVDQLHQEIAALQERTLQLEALTAQLEADRSQAKHSEVTLAETLQKTSKVSSELAALRQENQTLMQELVGAKLELAQCSEREVIGRRELYKAKETNMKLASKMTKLETLVYNRK